MKNEIEYKGYIASLYFDQDDNIFVGEVTNLTRDIIVFHADAAHDMMARFMEAVDDYIDSCKEFDRKPEEPRPPFTGNLRVRLAPNLHRLSAMEAERNGISLNGFLQSLVENYFHKAR